ncbi:hypothetical protein D7W79_20765 [Corallococcus exercitus]|uniref:Uncharacterized protein n=1 Tax=Corallococcus exercitus TaxID=2316736 RepID=A0A3A8I635_9BACT|nr:hypothetical protein [Corallococcus exercitus]NOK32164.1 hypothetical protein [Corallococcus exercitus]RKG75264.1 hypothetical protein D7W79_20765 [Corallococcus exercitus]
MKAMLLSLLLLGAAPSGPAPSSLPPEALGAPPLVDASPTAWACTIDTLRAGKECVFEAELPPPGAANADVESANVKLLKDASRALCSEAVSNARDGTPDPKLVAVCERKYADVVGRCGIDGNSPVVDAKGRFAPVARACYRALSTVLQDVQLMASVASTCCECAARSQCPGTGDSCYAAVSRQQAGPTTLACMDDRCHDACSMMLPPSASIPRQAPSRASSQHTDSASL